MKPHPVGLSRAKFDLSLSLRAQEDGSIAGVLEYDADLFEASRIVTDMQRWERMLGQLIAHEALTQIDWLDEAEHQQLAGFNATEQPVSETSVSERFYVTAADYPDARALVCGDDVLTYRQLHEAASKLARYLIAQSIGPEDVVGICLERSSALIIAMLGVVHSGAAYLPLDPAQPDARLKGHVGGQPVEAVNHRAGILLTFFLDWISQGNQRHWLCSFWMIQQHKRDWQSSMHRPS